MGFLFGSSKKVMPKVPFPQGRSLDDKTLRLSVPTNPERIIEPEQVKQAAGVSKPFSFPSEPQPQERTVSATAQRGTLPTAVPAPMEEAIPMFVKIEIYQQILDELDGLKKVLGTLQETNRRLDKSEYNEEHHFEKMRRSIKGVHDRLLQMDKKLFKSLG